MFLEVVMDDVLAFENLLKKRKATRSFLPIKIDENLIKRFLVVQDFAPPIVIRSLGFQQLCLVKNYNY